MVDPYYLLLKLSIFKDGLNSTCHNEKSLIDGDRKINYEGKFYFLEFSENSTVNFIKPFVTIPN